MSSCFRFLCNHLAIFWKASFSRVISGAWILASFLILVLLFVVAQPAHWWKTTNWVFSEVQLLERNWWNYEVADTLVVSRAAQISWQQRSWNKHFIHALTSCCQVRKSLVISAPPGPKQRETAGRPRRVKWRSQNLVDVDRVVRSQLAPSACCFERSVTYPFHIRIQVSGSGWATLSRPPGPAEPLSLPNES